MGIFSCRFNALFLAWVILLADIFSKYWVQRFLPLQSELVVWQNLGGIGFSIVHVINRGAAWGLLADYQFLLLLFRIVMIGFLLAYFFLFKVKSSSYLPLALIIAGALGNVLDYFLYGHVVDMFYFAFWGRSYGIFNVADAAITCGVVLLLVSSWSEKKQACSL